LSFVEPGRPDRPSRHHHHETLRLLGLSFRTDATIVLAVI
jgi:hypothetical protein